MSRRNKDRIFVPDLDKDLIEKLRAKLRHELFNNYSEKYEIGPQTTASGYSIGTLTVVIKNPSKKQYSVHIEHIKDASFRIQILSSDISYRSNVEFKEIRKHFHSLVEFLKKI